MVKVGHLSLRIAQVSDAEAICNLYKKIYDKSYPLPFGSDLNFTKEALKDQKKWMVFVVDGEGTSVVGAINLEIDESHQLAIIQGLVIDPEHRKGSLGSTLVNEASDTAFKLNKSIQSVYGTARVINRAPQKICLQSKYLPFGFYPNMYFINDYESMALVALHRQGILEKRVSGYWIPNYLDNLYRTVNKTLDARCFYPCKDEALRLNLEEEKCEVSIAEYEMQGDEQFKAELTTPLLKVSHIAKCLKGDKVYLSINKSSKHASIIGASVNSLSKKFIIDLKNELQNMGVNYIQTYLRADQFELMNQFVGQGFIPSAIYPAMRKVKGAFYDYVILCYTFEPVDFAKITFEKSFYPYVDSYLKLDYRRKLNELNFFKVA